MRHAEQLGELYLLDHLPGDGLQCGEGEEELAESTPAVVLAVADVVLQVDLDLVAEGLHAVRLAQALGVWKRKVRRLLRVIKSGRCGG